MEEAFGPSDVELAATVADPENGKKLHVMREGSAAIRLDILASIARLSRFVAVTTVAATQYLLANVVPSELRSNLPVRTASRVTSSEIVDVALGAGMAAQVSVDAIGPDVLFNYGDDEERPDEEWWERPAFPFMKETARVP